MTKENIEAIHPLSPNQQAFLLHTLYAGRSELGFLQASGVLRGDLNEGAFRRAWQQIVDRHPTLRTSFHWEDLDEPLQVVHQSLTLPWVQKDWRGMLPAEQQERFESFLQADKEQGFNLSEAPLTRLALMQVTEDSYHFVWSFHHVVMDGWSLSLLLKEILAFYDAYCQDRELHLERPRPYGDYIAWLRRQDLGEAETFWRQALKGFTVPTPLRTDQNPSNAPGQQEDYEEREIKLSQATTQILESFARRHQLTLNTLAQGAWALLLSRYSGEQDVVFGATVLGRPTALVGVESMVGLFINTLPVRVQVSPGASMLSWLKKLQARQVELGQYENTPLVKVQEWSELPGSLPLFETLLVFENYAAEGLSEGQGNSLEFNILRGGVTTKYPLTLVAEPGPELLLGLVYDRRRFDAATITRMLRHFQILLEAMVVDPDQPVGDLPDLIPADEFSRVAPPPPTARRSQGDPSFVAPRDQFEQVLADTWADVLGLEQVGIQDDFFVLGGHSLLAVTLTNEISRRCGRQLSLVTLFKNPTVIALADSLRQDRDSEAWSPLVPIRPLGDRTPFFFVPGGGGGEAELVFLYSQLAEHLGEDQPVYGLRAPRTQQGAQPNMTVERLAGEFIEAMQGAQPTGPYLLGGECLGGIVAFEMARQLVDRGEAVGLLVLSDTHCPDGKG